MNEAPLQPGTPLSHPAEILEILEKYHDMWNARFVVHRNPCPQPVSLERKHFDIIRANQYVVADKSDGVRYTLFLTRVGGREVAVLIDRKLEIYQCPVAATKKCFDGSIFDGELLWHHRTGAVTCQTFLVFDAVAWRGDKSIGSQSLHTRLELIRKTFWLESGVTTPEAAQEAAKAGKIVCGGNAYGLSFHPKQCMPLDMLDTLLRQIRGNSLPYQTDGLLLTPVDEPVRSGTHETMFKLKWKHTIDLQVNLPSSEILYGLGGVVDADVRSPASDLGLFPDESFWGDLRESLKSEDGVVNLIVECEISPDCSGLSFRSLRRDKRHPNTRRTIERTLINVQEAISAEELLAEVAPERQKFS